MDPDENEETSFPEPDWIPQTEEEGEADDYVEDQTPRSSNTGEQILTTEELEMLLNMNLEASPSMQSDIQELFDYLRRVLDGEEEEIDQDKMSFAYLLLQMAEEHRDQSLGEYEGELQENEETEDVQVDAEEMRTSLGATMESEAEEEQPSSGEEEIDLSALMDEEEAGDYTSAQTQQPDTNQLGYESFKYFEPYNNSSLTKFLKQNEEERMEEIKNRLDQMIRISPPETFDQESLDQENKSSVFVIKEAKKDFPDMSYLEMGAQFAEDEGFENHHLQELITREWAVKHADSFIRKADCEYEEEDEEEATQEEEREPRLDRFLEHKPTGTDRRKGVGNKEGAPEITDKLVRKAERTLWRAVVEGSKPKYPLPRYILPRHKYLRRVEASLIGPGSYELDYLEDQRKKKLQTMISWSASCNPRFPKERRAAGAGNVYLNNPYTKWEAACDHHRHPGKVSMFQSTPCNFRYKNFYVGCGTSPAQYNIKSSIEEYVSKWKSLRGMYAEGSGDNVCKKKPATKVNLGPGSYNTRLSLIKDITGRCKNFKGKFSKTPRHKMFGFKEAFNNPLWPTAECKPGPAQYDPYGHENWIEPAWAPFGSLAPARNLGLNIQSKLTSPDYYFYEVAGKQDKRWKRHILGDGMRSSFLSKAPQTTPHSQYVKIKQRTKPTNLKFDQEMLSRTGESERLSNECVDHVKNYFSVPSFFIYYY